MTFGEFFRTATGRVPHKWLARIASDPVCTDWLVRIPTGFTEKV